MYAGGVASPSPAVLGFFVAAITHASQSPTPSGFTSAMIGAIMGLHSNGTSHTRDCWSGIEAVMQNMRAHLEKLKSEAEDCALISELAADPQKRVLFGSLSRHLKQLASEVELAIQDKLEKEEG